MIFHGEKHGDIMGEYDVFLVIYGTLVQRGDKPAKHNWRHHFVLLLYKLILGPLRFPLKKTGRITG
jgi:hypothetical protein